MRLDASPPFPRAALTLIAAAACVASAPAAGRVPQDRGAAGTWQMLQKLRTTASAMHTTAHPDDEHGGVLALLSRRDGARVSMLTLTRGESGDNAIGAELFDALGLIRTEELLLSNRYYGVDRQYFTTAVDYGFSKRLDEAYGKWGREEVLRDMVRVIRTERPYVLISRFQGNARDGHGHHQAAGALTQAAFEAAADAARFPDQIRDGLRPWRALKVYIGGVREDETWTVRVDPGEFSPWIGDSYATFARLGLSFQRSQNAGRFNPVAGPAPAHYRRVAPPALPGEKETSFFDGIDTSIGGLFTTLGRPEPQSARALLQAVEDAVAKAAASFSMQDPSAAAPHLAAGLGRTRAALSALASEPEIAFALKVKEEQFQEAINRALGIDLGAVAQPVGALEPAGPFAAFAPPPQMSAPVPGQTFEVRTQLTNRGSLPIALADISIAADPGWTVTGNPGDRPVATLERNAVAARSFTVTLTREATLGSRPYFTRPSIHASRYTLLDAAQFGRPAAAPSAVAVARYTVAGVEVRKTQPVQRREPTPPYGDALRELRAVPGLAVRVSPAFAVVPLGSTPRRVPLTVALLNNHDGAIDGHVSLTLPPAWTSEPARHLFSFGRAGERSLFNFTVTVPAAADRSYAIEAVATAGGRRYAEGYDLVDHRDLELRYLYKPSAVHVRGVDLAVVPDLKVGYVMGVGDQVPAGIAQLGYAVTLLDEAALASDDLSPFDAIVTGTRAYAVRDDLRTYNARLLDYVRNGGNLIVLYNTPELVPATFAPFPAEHGPRAEEVSEEDSPITILAPTAQAFSWPNRITAADFEGWVEQRGSKFWASWDAAYRPMLETFDTGQAPQRGGWLEARSGKGTYTYFAYAFHRQLPYGVPGAYRLLANVLALGRTPPGTSRQVFLDSRIYGFTKAN